MHESEEGRFEGQGEEVVKNSTESTEYHSICVLNQGQLHDHGSMAKVIISND